ncbi:hypothetical protein [Streptomyces albireticuli]|uniref:hypothetical protein n=1 Tax=Streptomyces albireticuli TaxID=1940 RepID=UPI00117F97B9|nr:hypothetical protein [Streptomyces albireticuli]MCD9195305.1 hypothetical protein [Streptomyces albireticuli]
MPLSVAELAERAGSRSLLLKAEEFDDTAVREVLATHLGASELALTDVEYDAASLTARGRCAVPSLGPEPRPAVAEFLTDASGTTAVGLVLIVEAPEWRLPEPFPALDLGPLEALGAQAPVIVLNATPEPDGEAERDRVPAVAGVRCAVPGTEEPLLFLASLHEGAYTLSARFPDGLSLPSLRYVSDLPGWTGADTVTEHFPAHWQGLLASALPSLRDVTLSYAPGDGRMTGDILVGLADEWPVLEGVTLSRVTARITMDSAARHDAWAGLSVELSGHLALAGLESTVTVALPSLTAHGELAAGKELLGGIASDLGEHGTGRLSFLCDLREGTFLAAGQLLGPWEIAGVRIEDQAVMVTGGGDRALEATLAGTLVLGGTRIGVRGNRTAQGWGLTVEMDHLAVGDLSAWAEQAMGSRLPAALDELTLENLYFEVASASAGRTFAMEGSAEFPLPAGLHAGAHLAAQITTGDGAPEAEATGTLVLSGPDTSLMELDLVVDKGPDATSWTATWAAPEGVPLGQAVAPFLPATGSPLSGLPDLLPTVEKISLRHTGRAADGTTGSLVLTADTRKARAVLVVTD